MNANKLQYSYRVNLVKKLVDVVVEMFSSTTADIEPGEMKYNRMVKEEANVDLSAVPHITPSLGLVEGRDRRDASNRNRRPASLRQSLLLDSKENEIMGTERVDLSNLEGRRGTLSGKVSLSASI